ncbi:lamin tail domain-containing protein [Flammeovirga kamogawensis]|uniref:Lamin tail domain-containing protein n=1 Tax=Flammeovirga kamogawensis TaxID=373891 RepID=A0ABX8GSD8_9BACT|nr:lamin tail domain-containing protein [Flammeovirga kamogawensis]MBB6462681.1 hypothetical protein [Flammeovirga kamogawensis]QWG06082.1 lamin tail domain-containing protein [Flammeovirga kamogawensis]TRX67915.1 lamin tail domain-containing protein [Flammeovirga kamogawensis]
MGKSTSTGSIPDGWFIQSDYGYFQLNSTSGTGLRTVYAISPENISKNDYPDTLVWEFSFQHNFSISTSLQKTNYSSFILMSDSLNYLNGDYLSIKVADQVYFLSNDSLVIKVPIEETISGWNHLKIIFDGNAEWSVITDFTDSISITHQPNFETFFTGFSSHFTSASRGKHFLYDNFYLDHFAKAIDYAVPILEKVSFSGDSIIQFIFNEKLDSNCFPDLFIDGINRTTYLNEDTLFCLYPSSLEIDKNYNFTIDNLCDLSGNSTSITSNFIFEDTTPPFILSATPVNAYSCWVDFSEEINNLATDDISIKWKEEEIFIDSYSFIDADSTRIFIVFSTSLPANENIELRIKDLSDHKNNSINSSFTFEYDTRAPRLLSFSINTSNRITLNFNDDLDKLEATDNFNYTLINEEIHPSQIIYNDSSVFLLFDGVSFSEGDTYGLSIRNLQDNAGNILKKKNIYFQYDTIPPVLTDIRYYFDSLFLQFSEPILQNLSIEINERVIDYKKNSCPSDILYLNIGVLDSAHQLKIVHLEDEHGNVTNSISQTIKKEQAIVDIYAYSRNEIIITFTDTSALENINLKPIGFSIDKVTKYKNRLFISSDIALKSGKEYLIEIDKSIYKIAYQEVNTNINTTPYSSTLTFEENINTTPLSIICDDLQVKSYKIKENILYIFYQNPLIENHIYNVSINGLETCKGKKLALLETQFVIDNELPIFSSCQFNFSNSLLIECSEKLVEEDVLQFKRYQLKDYNLSDISYLGNQILLVFDKDFKPNITLNLEVKNGLRDLSGNKSETTIFELQTPREITVNDIVINELLIDPSPSVGLPNSEAIELLNLTDDTLSLMQFKILINNDTFRLINRALLPNEYVVLVDTKSIDLWSEYDDIVGVENLSILRNDRDTLQLISLDNTSILDEVYYSKKSYKNNTKAEGGYTLERIDPLFNCANEINWKVTNSSLGGTLGMKNSVFAQLEDNQPPYIANIKVINNVSIQIQFNEPIFLDSLISTISCSINNVDNSVSNSYFVNNSILNLTLNEKIPPGMLVKVTVDNFYDCFNNIQFSDTDTFFVSPKVNYQQLLITELMTNHSFINGLPSSEYIELYNNSDLYLYINDCVMLLNGVKISLPIYSIKPREYLILTPFEHVDNFLKKGINAIGIKPWKNLNNTEGEIQLFNKENEEIQRINYTPFYYQNRKKSKGGWSLEMIDFQSSCVGIRNWKASEDSRGGTPAEANSVTGFLEDYKAPELLETFAINDTVYLEFDEEVSTLLSQNIIVKYNDDIIPLNQLQWLEEKVFFVDKKKVNSEVEISVENISDCLSNINLKPQQKQLIKSPENVQLYLSELLFDPSILNEDFVEIYNASSGYINLKNYKIGNINNEGVSDFKKLSTKSLFMPPKTWYVFTNNVDKLLNFYPSALSTHVFELTLPSYPNKEGGLILTDHHNKILEQFYYNDNMHQKYLKNSEDVSLERIDYKKEVSLQDNWTSAIESVGFATPTKINSRNNKGTAFMNDFGGLTVNTTLITANGDGTDDFLLIENNNEFPLRIFRLEVYNVRGHLISSLRTNFEIGNGDVIRWDGKTASGEQVYGKFLLLLLAENRQHRIEKFTKVISVATWN